MFHFLANDWYWIVGGTGHWKERAEDPFSGDESRVYSSKKQCYVPAEDPEYQAWKKLTGSNLGLSDPTTRIDTEENLRDALKQHGIECVFGEAKE